MIGFFFFFSEKDNKENDNQAIPSGLSNPLNNQRYNNFPQKSRFEKGSSRTVGRERQSGPPDSRSRDDRSRQSNTTRPDQKPPRFQNQHNQHQRYNDSFQNWSYNGGTDYVYDDRSNFNNSRFNRNSEEFNSDSFNRRVQPPPSFVTSEPSHDSSRGNRRYDMHCKHQIKFYKGVPISFQNSDSLGRASKEHIAPTSGA